MDTEPKERDIKEVKDFVLEQIKLLETRELKFEEWQFSVTKFYFTGFFSLITVILGLYNLGALRTPSSLWPLFAVVSLFSTAVISSLSNLNRERLQSKINKDFMVNYYLGNQEVSPTSEQPGSTFLPLRNLVYGLALTSYVATFYFAIPQISERLSAGLVFGLVLGAIATTGILSSLVIVSLSAARKKALDTKRKNDIRNLSTALAQYYVDKGSFPVLAGNIDALWPYISDYLTQKPVDPKDTEKFIYSYESQDGKVFKLFYRLEETNEDQVYDSTAMGF